MPLRSGPQLRCSGAILRPRSRTVYGIAHGFECPGRVPNKNRMHKCAKCASTPCTKRLQHVLAISLKVSVRCPDRAMACKGVGSPLSTVPEHERHSSATRESDGRTLSGRCADNNTRRCAARALAAASGVAKLSATMPHRMVRASRLSTHCCSQPAIVNTGPFAYRCGYQLHHVSAFGSKYRAKYYVMLIIVVPVKVLPLQQQALVCNSTCCSTVS
jgi:hypothetical protein